MKKRLLKYLDKIYFSVIDYLFRKKSLNFILYVLIVFILTELTAISTSKSLIDFFNELKTEIHSKIFYWIIRILETIYVSGSYLSLVISIGLFILVFYLRRTELVEAKSGEKFKKVIDGLKKKNKEIYKALEQAQNNTELESRKKEEYRKFLDKINHTLQSENISKEELIKKVASKLKALIIYKSYEDQQKIIRDQIYSELGVVNISSGLSIIPPNRLNQKLSDAKLLNWFKKEVEKRIPDTYDYNFSIVAVVDLTKITAYKRLKPFRRINRTYLDKIRIEDLVSLREIESYLYTEKNISSKEIIETASVGFLIDSNLITTEDYEILKKNNDKIIAEINERLGSNNIRTTQFANIENSTLNSILSRYIENPEEITLSIKTNAQFWKDYFEKNI